MVMMFAAGTMDVRGGTAGRRRELSGDNDALAVAMTGQVLGDLRMGGAHVPDERLEKPLRLKRVAGKLRHKLHRPVEHLRCALQFDHLLRLLLLERLVLLFQVLGEDGKRRARHMQRAQAAAQSLEPRDDFRILPVPPVLEVPEGDHFDQIEQGHGLVSGQLGKLAIELAA